jgi:polar amino acid transport system permease protein
VSLLGVGDVSFASYLVRLATQESAQIYTIALVIYFVLAFALTRSMKALERKTKRNIGIEPEPGGFAGVFGKRAGSKIAGTTVVGGASK